jgi:hypothetical protein
MSRVKTIRGFTVNQLQKRLKQLIDAGHGRSYVHVDTDSFKNNLDATICQVHGIGFVTTQILDDDGFAKVDSRGVHVEKSLLTLVGACKANSKGEIVREAN